MQERRIARCRSAAGFAELSSVFRTMSSNKLEVLIDGATGMDELGNPMWSGKYRKMIALSRKVKVTSISNELVDLAKKKSGGKANLLLWREHVLFELLQEPPLSSERVYEILVSSPLWVRRKIFVDGWLSDQPPLVNLSRHPLERDTVLGIRNRKTLDAFIALLALAREAEHASHHQQHSLPAVCALEIFPYILKDHPHLRARWVDLYDCLMTSFWSRIYGANKLGVKFNFLLVQEALVAVLRDPHNPKLPVSMGITRAEVKRRKHAAATDST